MSLLRTMTVGDLIKHLKQFDSDALVVFSSDYGDRSHTEQAGPIKDIELATLVESSYSDSGFKVVRDDDELEASDEQIKGVVVISDGRHQ